jgi:hypothetical protein
MEVVETTIKVDGPVRVVRVQSESRPNLSHKVTLACTCEGFRYAGHCRHLELAAGKARTTARLMRSILG